MAAAGATLCSARIGPLKEKKNLRECCKYLKDNRLDRTQFWRRVGNVLVCDLEALRQEKDQRNAGQRQKQGVLYDIAAVGLHIPLGISALGAAWLGDKDKEQTEGASEMIAQSHEYWHSR